MRLDVAVYLSPSLFLSLFFFFKIKFHPPFAHPRFEGFDRRIRLLFQVRSQRCDERIRGLAGFKSRAVSSSFIRLFVISFPGRGEARLCPPPFRAYRDDETMMIDDDEFFLHFIRKVCSESLISIRYREKPYFKIENYIFFP